MLYIKVFITLISFYVITCYACVIFCHCNTDNISRLWKGVIGLVVFEAGLPRKVVKKIF